ncbi:MAG TPA: metal-dependent transcriptional regulator [Actinomycetota bacterium]|nr:metal-dependent transcriptional regulator [Actinomycetota bacterium]
MTGLDSSTESYLEAVFELAEIGERVTAARLARWFQVAAPASAEVVARIEHAQLVAVEPDGTVVLSERGRAVAEQMAGRHRIIERYLVDVLGVPWHLADEETRKMEPGVSDVVVDRMRESIGDTNRCPHGNPIPGLAPVPPVDLTPLDECGPGSVVLIDRIREDLELDLDMLRYLEDHDLLPGRRLTVSERDPHGAVTVTGEGSPVSVGPAIASHVLCVSA